MADTTLRLRYPTGAALYAQVEDESGQVWNGSAFVPFVLANWATYAVSASESPSGSGRYSAQFPTSPAPSAGSYGWGFFLRAGGSPASSDACVSPGNLGYWDGSTFGKAAVDLGRPVPVRSQDAVAAPTIGDALLGAWTEPFGSESANATSRAYQKKGPDGSTVRGFTLTTDINNNVTARE